jgi:hypothetical protein
MSNEDATKMADSISRELYTYAEDGNVFGIDEDTQEEATAYDYLEDALDIEYRVGSDGKYRSAKVLTGWGGPNVWIDTARQQVAVAWYCEPVYRDLPVEFCNELDEALAELWSIR